MEISFKDEYQYKVFHALQVIRMYDWLLNSFVLDFFVENHWRKLPASWRMAFETMEPSELGYTISNEKSTKLLPLSFLALKKCVQILSIPRENDKPIDGEKIKVEPKNNSIGSNKNDENDLETNKYTCADHPRLKNIFLKHVKKKKRHEVCLIADLVNKIANEEKCFSVVDIGSGLGHLVRTLSYKYNMKSVGIEAQNDLTISACELDNEFEYSALKCIENEEYVKSLKPHHINLKLTHDVPENVFIESIKEYTGETFGLVGLHPCGDLGPLLMKTFIRHPEIKFICIVGCCYMKLSSDNYCKSRGYPLSKFTENLDNNELSYESREIACHAIESYCERLRRGLYEDLQVHTFRALLEKILVSKWPHMKHMGLRSVKHYNTLTFSRYCEIATERLGVKLSESETMSESITENLNMWKKVVTFYSLRLMLAPLVESVILMDRILYLREHGVACDIKPLFDPQVSPRNHILTARKIN